MTRCLYNDVILNIRQEWIVWKSRPFNVLQVFKLQHYSHRRTITSLEILDGWIFLSRFMVSLVNSSLKDAGFPTTSARNRFMGLESTLPSTGKINVVQKANDLKYNFLIISSSLLFQDLPLIMCA